MHDNTLLIMAHLQKMHVILGTYAITAYSFITEAHFKHTSC